MGNCEECGRYGPTDGHHIVFKGMGGYKGLDFPLNMKRLGNSFGCNCHEGNNGPHHNRKKDLEYKEDLQAKLKIVLSKEYYTIDEVIKTLDMVTGQAYKAFKKLHIHELGYERLDIIKRLMGDRFY